MTWADRTIATWPLAALVLALAACGQRAVEGQSHTDTGDAGAMAGTAPCPPAEVVSAAVGDSVVLVTALAPRREGLELLCGYRPPHHEFFVTLTVAAAAAADTTFAQVRTSARSFSWPTVDATKLDIGDEGWGYGTSSRSEAAAVAAGRLYRAEMEYYGYETVGDQQAAMVALIRNAIH